MAHPRALSESKERKMVEDYTKGKSSAVIAEKYGVHRSTVVAACQRAGVVVRKPGGSKPRKAAPAPAKKAVKKTAKAA